MGKGLGLVKLDPVKEKLEKLNIKDDAEINKIKDLVKAIKESKESTSSKTDKDDAVKAEKDKEGDGKTVKKRRAGAIDLDIFMSVKDTALFIEE